MNGQFHSLLTASQNTDKVLLPVLLTFASRIRSWMFSLLLLPLLSACATYAPSYGYPTRSYSYQPRAVYQNHYPPNHAYYGGYQPGWFLTMSYPGGYYGAWPYGPAPYRPGYSQSYYGSGYYSDPWYDPWNYSHSSYRRNFYGSGVGFGYLYFAPYGSAGRYGYPYYNRPYAGGSQSFRPPGQQQPVSRPGPDPVIISRDQRGRRGLAPGYRGDVAESPQQPDNRQPERRSATVVTEQQGMSRSVSVAPGNYGNQGMVVSSRNERKMQPSRLHPVTIQPDGSRSAAVPNESSNSRKPASPQQPAQPVTRISRNPGFASPGRARQGQATAENAANSQSYAPARNAPVSNAAVRNAQARPAPARDASAYPQQPPQRSEPVYQQPLNSSNVIPRAERRQDRNTGPDTQRDRQHEK